MMLITWVIASRATMSSRRSFSTSTTFPLRHSFSLTEAMGDFARKSMVLPAMNAIQSTPKSSIQRATDSATCNQLLSLGL